MKNIQTIVCPPLATNSYCVSDQKSGRCCLVDPFDAALIISYMQKNRLIPDWIFLTHEHYDHLGAVNEIRAQYANCQLALGKSASERFFLPSKNLSAYFNVLFLMGNTKRSKCATVYSKYSCTPADFVVSDGEVLEWENSRFLFRDTPGHSAGSVCIILDDTELFSGDSLLRDAPVVTRLPGGSAAQYECVTRPILLNLNGSLIVRPGHGAPFRLCDSRHLRYTEKGELL